MKVSMDIVGDITGESGNGLHKARNLVIEPTFYTGNKKSAVSFIKAVDKEGKAIDEVMLQVNDDGKLSIARKRDV